MQKLTDEQKQLLSILKGDNISAAERINIPLFLKLLYRHKLLPISETILPFLSTNDQDVVKAELFKWSLKAEKILFHLERIARKLNDENIEVVSLKGPLLAYMLYKSINQRFYTDLDILIQREDLPNAILILASLHFTMVFPNRPLTQDQYNNVIALSNDIQFYNKEDNIQLELHLKLLSNYEMNLTAQADLLKETKPIYYGSGNLKSMGNEESFLYLCAHGTKHMFYRLSWLKDIAACLENWRLSHSLILEKTEKLRLENAVGLSLILAKKYFDISYPSIYQPLINRVHGKAFLVKLCEEAIFAPEEVKIRRIIFGSFRRGGFENEEARLIQWIARFVFPYFITKGFKSRIKILLHYFGKRRIAKKYR